jgi:cation diffusion facilitator family transporter
MIHETSEQVRLAVARGARVTVIGVLSSSLLALAKIIAGIAGHSYALIADGIESILDVFSSLVVLGSLRLSATPQTQRFPYGLGKAEPLAALVVATVLLVAAVGIASQAVHEIVTPHRAPAPFTLLVLVGVVIAKEVIFRLLFTTGREIGSGALRADAWHHRSDALTSLAAFVGISVALVAGEGYEAADDWAALLACGIIAFNGVRLLRSALQEVLDVAPSEAVYGSIRYTAGAVRGVEGIDLIRVRRSGLVLIVDIHVEVDGSMSVQEGHEIAHQVKDALIGSELPIIDALVHIEPS